MYWLMILFCRNCLDLILHRLSVCHGAQNSVVLFLLNTEWFHEPVCHYRLTNKFSHQQSLMKTFIILHWKWLHQQHFLDEDLSTLKDILLVNSYLLKLVHILLFWTPRRVNDENVSNEKIFRNEDSYPTSFHCKPEISNKLPNFWNFI